RAGQLDRGPGEERVKVLRAAGGASQLPRALEEALEQAAPFPKVGQGGARRRPPLERLAAQRARLEQLATRVDLELDQTGCHPFARRSEAVQFGVAGLGLHVSRRTQ